MIFARLAAIHTKSDVVYERDGLAADSKAQIISAHLFVYIQAAAVARIVDV